MATTITHFLDGLYKPEVQGKAIQVFPPFFKTLHAVNIIIYENTFRLK